jgi:gamma-glutamylcyclotransferase (GGCT)/AIG2-like uncharacterized protein YtfP
MPQADLSRGLFVYGSLLWPDRRIAVIGREVRTSPARLAGWRVRSGRYLYIVEEVGAVTMGLILHDLDAADWNALDSYEDTPRLYTREPVEVTDEDGAPVVAWIYIPTDLVRSGGG